MSDAIEQMRKDLASQVFDQGVHWRILFIGRSVNGTTDIVSCLSRSLRNLGHHVFDLDLKKHRDVVDNPGRVNGGHGPIFVRVAGLETLLSAFEPQIIVCCAGGLTFRPDDAQALKARGMVLLGLTLSDPDVFPSVSPHAGVFDLHTTNAHMALEMYRRAGVHNTVCFPFGIDRGFVTQQTPLAAELAADVICMGHATGRPERNALMSSLARDFDVKTYGRGWELPGSEPVAGERMVQAMRMGRVHVNFPLTRAGYINIKCGVFESVGSGALLCTGRFSEMAEFFRYDDEIIGYDDDTDLAEQLRILLAQPERYREITERAFRRLIDEHLYEHRWMSLLERLFNLTPESAPWLDDQRVAAIRQTLAASLPRAKKVIVSGFYGASNLGDELILASIRQGLQRADQATQVWVAAENPGHVERDHGLQAFSRKQHHESLQAVRTASAVVLGGGGLWHDYTFERSGGMMGLFTGTTISIAGFGILPLLGGAFDVPFHVVGMGVGPLQHPDARRMVKLVARQAETIYVRDEPSAELLRPLGLPEDRLVVAPDVVYALQLPAPVTPHEVSRLRAEGHVLIGLNLRPWARMDETTVVDAIANALLTLAQEHPIAVVGLPMQAGERVDVAILGKVAVACGPRVPMVVLPAPMSIATLTGTLSHLSALLSMRLHACLVAHRMRIPVVGIAYDPKVASHFDELGRSRFALTTGASCEDYRSALADALAEGGALPDGSQRALEGLEHRARQALAVAANRIAALPTAVVVYEIPSAVDSAPKPAPIAPSAPPAVRQPEVPVAAAPAARTVAAAPALVHEPPTMARFVDWTASARALVVPGWKPGVLTGAPARLEVSLPTRQPMKHQTIEVSARLMLASTGPLECVLAVESAYERHQNLGRVFFEVQIGPHCFTEDIAWSAEPVVLRLETVGADVVDISLRLMVARDAAHSAAWPRVSRVGLALLECRAKPGVTQPLLTASRGLVQAA